MREKKLKAKTVLNETNSHPQLAWGKNYYMI